MNLGKFFFKYLKVFVSAMRCFSGRESGSFIRQINEQMSFPPIVIVTIFQSNLKLTLLSCLIRWTNAFACGDSDKNERNETTDFDAVIVVTITMYGISLETAPISAKLNCDALWNGYESPSE